MKIKPCKNSTRLWCYISVFIYSIALMTDTGIEGGVEFHTDTLKGFHCVALGWLCIGNLNFFVLWLTNILYFFTIWDILDDKKIDQALRFSAYCFIAASCYFYHYWKTGHMDKLGIASYFWLLSYFVILLVSIYLYYSKRKKI